MSLTVGSACPVGNKNDDPDRKVVLTADAQTFAQQMGIQLFETSAKENINVEEVRRRMTMMSTFIAHDSLNSALSVLRSVRRGKGIIIIDSPRPSRSRWASSCLRPAPRRTSTWKR